MLQSQFTANAQHPDKYAGQEFEVRKATHMPLDGSPLTLEEIRFLESNAFKFPQLAEKYKVHEVMHREIMPPKKDLLPQNLSRSEALKQQHERVLAYLAQATDWVCADEIGVALDIKRGTIRKYLIELRDQNKVIRDLRRIGKNSTMAFFKIASNCDTSPH